MAFPAQVFYSILEVSLRWGCSVTQGVNNAIADEIDLVRLGREVPALALQDHHTVHKARRNPKVPCRPDARSPLSQKR